MAAPIVASANSISFPIGTTSTKLKKDAFPLILYSHIPVGNSRAAPLGGEDSKR